MSTSIQQQLINSTRRWFSRSAPSSTATSTTIAQLSQLQQRLFAPLHSSGSIPIPKRLGPALLSYYPPDISPAKLASKDPALASLNLVDVVKEAKIAQERALEERGKSIRVSVLDGKRKAPEKQVGKKKKRK